jgi:hypothetical protein
VIEQTCEAIQTQGLCEVVSCTWSDFTSIGSGTVALDQSFDWSAVKNTLLLMTGFDAQLGIPGGFAFIGNFIFFWLPFFMLLWSVYMALPFIH